MAKSIDTMETLPEQEGFGQFFSPGQYRMAAVVEVEVEVYNPLYPHNYYYCQDKLLLPRTILLFCHSLSLIANW